MATVTVDVDTLKNLVLRELERSALRPTELLSILGDRYSDEVIKEVVLRLLQERRIEMTSNRELHLAEKAA